MDQQTSVLDIDLATGSPHRLANDRTTAADERIRFDPVFWEGLGEGHAWRPLPSPHFHSDSPSSGSQAARV